METMQAHLEYSTLVYKIVRRLNQIHRNTANYELRVEEPDFTYEQIEDFSINSAENAHDNIVRIFGTETVARDHQNNQEDDERGVENFKT